MQLFVGHCVCFCCYSDSSFPSIHGTCQLQEEMLDLLGANDKDLSKSVAAALLWSFKCLSSSKLR